MFRRDLKRMWQNCWYFANHTPESSIEEAAGIVRSTIILEAMVQKFFAAYMEETELVAATGTWQADQDRRHDQKFVMCANPSFSWPGGGLGSPEPPVAAAEFDDDSDCVDLDEENMRIGATVGHKRKFAVLSDDDDVDVKLGMHTNMSGGTNGLDSNICALATIGENLTYSSGAT